MLAYSPIDTARGEALVTKPLKKQSIVFGPEDIWGEAPRYPTRGEAPGNKTKGDEKHSPIQGTLNIYFATTTLFTTTILPSTTILHI